MAPAEDLPRSPGRILVKLSGEVLSGPSGFGVDPEATLALADSLAGVSGSGTGVAVVLGGGNFFRGRSSGSSDRIRTDYMGMLGTNMNGLALEGAFDRLGRPCWLCSALPVPGAIPPWNIAEALRALEGGAVVLCAGGTGNPYLTTDTAAALRALQLGCDMLLKGTKVDGVYSDDPGRVPEAERFTELSYASYLQMGLGVMDGAAVAVCRDGGLPIVVFDIMSNPGNIAEAVRAPGATGTLIRGD